MGKIDVRGIMITGLLCASPLLVAANGCHCGAGDVPLGANRGLVADRSVPTIDGTATGLGSRHHEALFFEVVLQEGVEVGVILN